MAVPTSHRTEELLDKLFPPEQGAVIRVRLISEVSENIPYHEGATPTDMELIRFCIIKLCHQNFGYLSSAIKRAQTDWRDLLIVADFLHTNAHVQWYERVMRQHKD